jgi:hypothetical protein
MERYRSLTSLRRHLTVLCGKRHKLHCISTASVVCRADATRALFDLSSPFRILFVSGHHFVQHVWACEGSCEAAAETLIVGKNMQIHSHSSHAHYASCFRTNLFCPLHCCVTCLPPDLAMDAYSIHIHHTISEQIQKGYYIRGTTSPEAYCGRSSA